MRRVRLWNPRDAIQTHFKYRQYNWNWALCEASIDDTLEPVWQFINGLNLSLGAFESLETAESK